MLISKGQEPDHKNNQESDSRGNDRDSFPLANRLGPQFFNIIVYIHNFTNYEFASLYEYTNYEYFLDSLFRMRFRNS